MKLSLLVFTSGFIFNSFMALSMSHDFVYIYSMVITIEIILYGQSISNRSGPKIESPYNEWNEDEISDLFVE